MNPFVALFSALFSLYASIILLRFFLQYFRADYYNPLSQLIVKATDPLVKPLRKIIPGFGGLDIASLVLVWLVLLVKQILIIAIVGSLSQVSPVALLLYSLIDVALSAVGLFIFLIIVRAISSWFMPPGSYNPILAVFGQLTEPLLGRIRRLLPAMQGFDLSPLIALLLLFFIYNSINYYLLG
ncbi:MAG: YggT family protein [Kangiellaceae bacterium]|nr:YggT family protein [Kangiellaceae bacterium]MCW9000530.1 YggT family protein [Kangiellaceae bacterium]